MFLFLTISPQLVRFVVFLLYTQNTFKIAKKYELPAETTLQYYEEIIQWLHQCQCQPTPSFQARSQNGEKRLLSFVMVGCPSARNSVPTGRFFMKFDTRIFRKYVEKIHVSLKSDKNKEYFTLRPIYIFITCRSFLLRMRNCTENQNTHFAFSNYFFFFNRAVYETWKNIEERGRPQMTLWRKRIACYKYTHSGCVTVIAFPQQRLHERVLMLRYTYTACLVGEY